jgi:hypothetical protein
MTRQPDPVDDYGRGEIGVAIQSYYGSRFDEGARLTTRSMATHESWDQHRDEPEWMRTAARRRRGITSTAASAEGC